MTPFATLTGIAAPLPIANIDTDRIIPGAFLKGLSRDGLAEGLFAPLRYDDRGREQQHFILNIDPWRRAQILVTKENFGCGSSREHAAWALAEFGIGAVIAPSFADIFYSNALKNGLLPAIAAPDVVDCLLELTSDPDKAELMIDLREQKIRAVDGEVFGFQISPENREALLTGLDEIERTLQFSAQIAAFEEGHLPEIPAIPDWPELERRLG